MSNKVTVNVEINGIKYPVSCISGEEDRLIESSQEVNKVIEDLSKVSGVVGETRLLAMTSLILADKIINKESSSDKDLNLPFKFLSFTSSFIESSPTPFRAANP